MTKREIRLRMYVATIFGLVFASTALGNYINGDGRIIHLMDLTILPAMHFPVPHTRLSRCGYSFSITYATGMLTLCRPSTTSPLSSLRNSPSFQL
jgi:hypothetical protein